MPSGIDRPGTAPVSSAEMQQHHSGQCQPSVSFPGYKVWIPGNSEGNRKAAPCVLLHSSSVHRGLAHPGVPSGPALWNGAVLCAAMALTGLCVCGCLPSLHPHVLLQVPAGLAGRVRGCTCLGPVGLKSHPVHRSLGSRQPQGHRQSPLIKKEQAAGGSTGKEAHCEPASLGPWGWPLSHVPGQCLLFL